MIKKIKTTQLMPGMFVHDFACRWLENPFFQDSLLIKDIEMIEKVIASGIQEVYIDTEKGSDFAAAVLPFTPVVEEMPDQIGPPEAAFVALPFIERRLSGKSRRDLRDELPYALKLRQMAEAALEDVFDCISSGRKIDISATREVSEKMVESVFRNEFALPCIAKTGQSEKYMISRAINVSALMIAFAKYIGMQPAEVTNIGIGALLHDVGMLKLDQNLLKKPEKLTPAEYENIKMHALWSYEIIFEAAGEIQPALQMALLHHERFDGAGYSHGLKGGEIPKSVRMLSIADVFDAITSIRAYSDAMNYFAANRKLIELSSKGQLDKALVEWFIRCVGIYPVGTIVRLSSGKIGIVIQNNPHALLKPVVNVIYDSTKDRFVRRHKLDLSALRDKPDDGKIVSTGWDKSFKINPVDFLLS